MLGSVDGGSGVRSQLAPNYSVTLDKSFNRDLAKYPGVRGPGSESQLCHSTLQPWGSCWTSLSLGCSIYKMEWGTALTHRIVERVESSHMCQVTCVKDVSTELTHHKNSIGDHNGPQFLYRQTRMGFRCCTIKEEALSAPQNEATSTDTQGLIHQSNVLQSGVCQDAQRCRQVWGLTLGLGVEVGLIRVGSVFSLL